MKKKTGIIILIIMLAIGFAAVSTTLIINGTTILGTNEEDFKVIFSEAVIDGVDVTETAISEDGQTLTFTTSELAIKGEKSELLFEVRNNSTQYDAAVSMECVANGEHANNYYKIEENIPEVIMGGKRENGSVLVELTKTSVDEIEETFTCTITATATERTEAAKLGVTVTAKDASDNDLKATSDEITGAKETELLNSLVEDGYIASADDVSTLIDVKSDSFDNIAYTTFDVSNIAEPGDTVVIMHYNETTSEWEYIGTETVDENGLISGEFTSFSPVALIVVSEDGNLQNHTKHIDNDIDGICDICGKQGEIVTVYHDHIDGCYNTCTITYTYSYIGTYDGTIHAWQTKTHSKCGTASAKTKTYPASLDTYTTTHKYLTCGKTTETIEEQYTTFE